MNHKSKIFVSILAVLLVVAMGILSFTFSDEIESSLTSFVTARAFILEAEQENCTVELQKGLNVVSFICETGRSIDEALANNETFNYSVVYRFDSTNNLTPWRIYKKDLPSAIEQNLEMIRRNEGYIIIMDDESNYSYDGLLSAQTSVQLKEGWNLVGYPLNDERNTTLGFSSISDELVKALVYDSGWKTYDPDGTDEIQTLMPMKAYWILVNEDITWSVT